MIFMADGGERPKRASFIKIRYVIIVLATLCPIVCYISRQNLSMAIIAMVNDQARQSRPIPAANESSTSGSSIYPTSSYDGHKTCPRPTISNEDGDSSERELVPKTYGPRYDWSESEKSLVLEAFFFPYVICQIPGARLAERIGPHWVLMFAAAGSSLVSLLSPLAASVNAYTFAIMRVLLGISQATLYPALYVLYMKWLPTAERLRMLPLLVVGAYLGSIIASSSTGCFSASESTGWEFAFYTPGALCLVWSILWLWLGSSDPKQHRFISYEEIESIESHQEAKRSDLEPKRSISWTKVFKSQHVWALLIATLTSGWSFQIILLLLPTYLNHILYVPPVQNGLLNSVIYGLFCISSPIVGIVSTRMIETRPFGITRLTIRKLFQSVALIGQVICFIAIPILGCEKNAILAVTFLQIVLYSFINGGEVQLSPEISVEFAGTIYAIGNCVGSTTGFLVPRVKSWIVTDSYDRWQWSLYFYVAATISAIGSLLFIIFARNDLQDFSKDVSQSQIDICRLSTSSIRDLNASSQQKNASPKIGHRRTRMTKPQRGNDSIIRNKDKVTLPFLRATT